VKKVAFALLALMGSTYACEQFFSRMSYVKNEFRSRLTDDNLNGCVKLMAISSYLPDVKTLSSKLQRQKSH
jgi:hypothetical protein